MMPSPAISTWSEKLLKPMRASPKKSAVMVGLALILFVLVLRTMVGSSGPTSASASLTKQGPGTLSAAIGQSAEGYVHHATARDLAILEWARQPIIPMTRNVFAVPLDFYRRDGEHGGDLSVGAGFWDRLAKSLSAHADQQEQRQILIDNVRIMAGSLKLQSIVMGAQPSAMVNGEVVQQGSDIAGFRVMRIEPRTLIVERQGVRLAIEME
jgi:hypothetical protein